MYRWISWLAVSVIAAAASSPMNVLAQTDCPGAPPPRLTIGMQARVTIQGEGLDGVLRVRDHAGTEGNVLVDLVNGDTFSVIEGPVCAGDYWWWSIVTGGGIAGWVAEGSPRNYFVDPLDEPAPEPLPAAPNRLVTRLGNGRANSLAWSPDGQTLAIASSRGVWLYTPELEAIQLLESAELAEVAWNPDGTRLVGAASDGTLPIWDMTTRQLIHSIPGHSDPVRAVSWSFDGTMLASVSQEPVARVWDAASGAPITTLDLPGEAMVVQWNPAKNQLAASYAAPHEGGLPNFAAQIWEAESFAPIRQMDGLLYPPIRWSADGTQIAGFAMMDIFILTVSDGKQTSFMSNLNVGGSSELGDFVWTPEGDFLWGASYVSAESWSTAITRGVVTDAGYDFPSYETTYERSIRALALRPGGDQLAVIDACFLSLLDADTLTLLRQNQDFTYPIFTWDQAGQPTLSESPPETRLKVTVDLKQWALQIQDTATNQPPIQIVDGCFANSDFVDDFSPDESRIAVLCPYAYSISVWETATGSQSTVLSLPEISCAPDWGAQNCWMGWSATGRYIYLTGYDYEHQMQLLIWDFQTGENVLTRPLNGAAPLWSPDDHYFASHGFGQLIIWDTSTWQSWESSLSVEPPPYEWRLTWSPDSTHLASAVLMDQTVVIWDAASTRPAFELLGHTSSITSLSWSPDSTRLASGDYGGTVHIWDTATGQLLLTLPGHGGPIRVFYWKPDASQLAALSEERTVRVWDVR